MDSVFRIYDDENDNQNFGFQKHRMGSWAIQNFFPYGPIPGQPDRDRMQQLTDTFF